MSISSANATQLDMILCMRDLLGWDVPDNSSKPPKTVAK